MRMPRDDGPRASSKTSNGKVSGLRLGESPKGGTGQSTVPQLIEADRNSLVLNGAHCCSLLKNLVEGELFK